MKLKGKKIGCLPNYLTGLINPFDSSVRAEIMRKIISFWGVGIISIQEMKTCWFFSFVRFLITNEKLTESIYYVLLRKIYFEEKNNNK